MRRHAESRLDRCVSTFRSLFSRPIGSRAQLVHTGAFGLFTAGVAACARTTIRRALLEGIGAALGVRPDDRVVGAMLLRLRFGSEDDQYFGRVPASRARECESYHEQPQSEAIRRNLTRYHVGHGYFPVTVDPLPSRERAGMRPILRSSPLSRATHKTGPGVSGGVAATATSVAVAGDLCRG